MNIDYEDEYTKQLKKNMREVAKKLAKNDNTLMKTIRKWAEKHGFKYRTLLEKVRKDRTWQAVFTIDPDRQNVFKKIAAKYIESMPNVFQFKKSTLSYVQNGIPTDKKGTSRPISFSWIWTSPKNGSVYTCYAYCKYTREEGGTQNNSFDTVKGFIKDCKNSNGPNNSVYFFAICDGDYYTSSKISDLQTGAPTNLLVCSTEELYQFLK